MANFPLEIVSMDGEKFKGEAERLSLRFLDGAAEVRVEEIRREQQEESHGRKA